MKSQAFTCFYVVCVFIKVTVYIKIIYYFQHYNNKKYIHIHCAYPMFFFLFMNILSTFRFFLHLFNNNILKVLFIFNSELIL